MIGAPVAQGAISIFLAGALTASWAAGARGEPRVQWVQADGRTRVEVSNLDDAGFATERDWTPEQWRALGFRLPLPLGKTAAGQASDKNLIPSMLREYAAK